MHFGLSFVNGFNLELIPAARIITFMYLVKFLGFIHVMPRYNHGVIKISVTSIKYSGASSDVPAGFIQYILFSSKS